MKKLCLLLSIIMVFVLGTTAFAAGTTDAAIVLTPNKNSVAVGEIVTITVGITGDTEGLALYGTDKIAPTWDGNYFEYVADSAEVDSSTFELTNATTVATTEATTAYKVVFTQKVLNTEDRPSGDHTFGTFQLKALKATETTTAISLNGSSTSVYVNAGTTTTGRIALAEDTSIAITITGGAPAANEIDKLDTSIEGMDEIVSAFAGKYYVVGSAVALDAATAVENLYLYAQINNAGEKHYAEKSIGSLLKASGAGVVGSVVPVLVVADADAAALNYTFNADAKN